MVKCVSVFKGNESDNKRVEEVINIDKRMEEIERRGVRKKNKRYFIGILYTENTLILR
jgi:hypothetical protein